MPLNTGSQSLRTVAPKATLTSGNQKLLIPAAAAAAAAVGGQSKSAVAIPASALSQLASGQAVLSTNPNVGNIVVLPAQYIQQQVQQVSIYILNHPVCMPFLRANIIFNLRLKFKQYKILCEKFLIFYLHFNFILIFLRTRIFFKLLNFIKVYIYIKYCYPIWAANRWSKVEVPSNNARSLRKFTKFYGDSMRNWWKEFSKRSFWQCGAERHQAKKTMQLHQITVS